MISLFTSHKDPSPSPSEVTLTSLLGTTHGRIEKYGAAWSPATYPEGAIRGKANVVQIHYLVLDLDHLTRDTVVQVETNLASYDYVAHPSFSSDAANDDYCLRFVLSLSRPVLAEEWPRFWAQAVRELQVPADPSTSDASRIYFLPARPEALQKEYKLDVNAGNRLDVDAVMAAAPVQSTAQPSLDGYSHGDIPDGQREATLHRIASALRRYGCEEKEILATIRLRNASRCKPPLSDDEVVQTVASAQRYKVEDDQQELQEIVEYFKAKSPAHTIKQEGYVVDFMEFCDRHDANTDDLDKWLIEGVVGKGVPQILAGPPKAHKSWLMYHLGLSIASGRDWLGRYKTQRDKVLILSQEDDEKEAHRRFVRLAVAEGVPLEDLRGWVSINAVDRFSFGVDGYVEGLRATIERWEPGIVFIDCLARVHGSDENSATDMARVTDIWSRLCKEYGVAIVILHHYNKGEGNNILGRMRGSSDLGAMVRHVIGVHKIELDDPDYQGGVSGLDFDGNLPGTAESFSLGVRNGEVDGNKAVHVEYRSNATEEAFGQVKRDMVGFLLASEPEPVSKAQIFSSSKAPMSIRASVLKSLLDEGGIVEHGKRYRVGNV